MSEFTQDGVLRQAVAPMGQACSHALRERRALHGCRSRLVRRHSLSQQALDYRVGESLSKAPLPPPPHRPVARVLQQTHGRAQRRSSGR